MQIIQRWIHKYLQAERQGRANLVSKTSQKGSVSIPIRPHPKKEYHLPIHVSLQAINMNRLGKSVIDALGGKTNIESYREIPNSRRIRLTLVDPTLIDNVLLEEIDIRMFIRIGKRIVHIIP